jgi:uncharacterized membrane protein YczE
VGVVVLAVAVAIGARIGVGSVANAVLVGVLIDRLVAIDAVDRLSDESLGVRIALLALGLVAIGIGSGLYLGANLGAGPRDSLMVVGAARTRIRIGIVRAALELSALAAGILLGGKVGVGTLVFALGIGPAVEAAFWLVVRTGLADEPARFGRPAAGDGRTDV